MGVRAAARLLALAAAFGGSPRAAAVVSTRSPTGAHVAVPSTPVVAHRLDAARERLGAVRARPAVAPQATAPRAAGADLAPTPMPIEPYDPQRSADMFRYQPLRVLLRQAEVVIPFSLFVARVLADVASGTERAHRPRRAAELLALLSGLGPAIIKAGQALASRSDLLPPEYLVELQKLHDTVPPFPTPDALRVLREELGVEPSVLFSEISAEPIAAASLGQVYRARRAESGEQVAIKVQRPGCVQIAALDLHILRGYAWALNSVLRALRRDVDLVSVVDDLGTMLFGELDFGLEAAHATRFAELYATPGPYGVGAPRVYRELTTRRVLVERWVEGVRLTDSVALREWGLDADSLVDTLVQCSLRQMLDVGFFHADPHAGNLLVTRDGTLTYIDFGMVSTVSREQRLGLVEAVIHLVSRDYESLALLYKQLGFIPRSEPIEPIVAALNAALPDALDAPVSELNIKKVVGRLGSVMFEYPFALPPFYTAVIRCLGVLEGVALQSAASFPIIRAAYPFVAAKLLTDPAPRLQRALLGMLRRQRSARGSARLAQFIELLEHALRATDPLTLTERLAATYLHEEHAPLLRELMGQLVDELDLLISRAVGVGGAAELARPAAQASGRRAPAAAASAGSAAVGEAGEVVAEEEEFPHDALERAVHALRVALGELASGSVDARSHAERLTRALLSQPPGQQMALELGLKLNERAMLRGAGLALGWPEHQLHTSRHPVSEADGIDGAGPGPHAARSGATASGADNHNGGGVRPRQNAAGSADAAPVRMGGSGDDIR